MQLSELAATAAVSAASIKYYRREGLLPPGRRITTTRQDYDQRHLDRLALIQVLREMTDASVPRIARLTAILDDPQQPLLTALADAQAIALDLEEDATAGPSDAGAPAEHPAVAALLQEQGWPDTDSAARRGLDRLLRRLESWGMPSSPALLQRYAGPMAEIARADVDWIRTLPGEDADAQLSDDVVVLRAVAGTVAYDRLVRVLRALGHTSFSIMEAGHTDSPRQ